MYMFNYRVVTVKAGLAGTAILNWGYVPAAGVIGVAAAIQMTRRIVSETEALTQAHALNNRFQQLGQDCITHVFGQIVDDQTGNLSPAPADGDASYTLTADDKAEQLFASVDTPDLGATEKINLANRLPAELGAFDAGFPAEDAPALV